MARIVELIETSERRGSGADADPCRIVRQWFLKDGELLFEIDPLEDRRDEEWKAGERAGRINGIAEACRELHERQMFDAKQHLAALLEEKVSRG